MYGSQSELLAQGVDPKQLLGLISQTDQQRDKRDQFSVDTQDDGKSHLPPLASCRNLSSLFLLLLTTDQAKVPQVPSSSPPVSPGLHVPLPLSPLVQFRRTTDETSPFLKPDSMIAMSPSLRKRRHDGELFPDNLEVEVSPFDTASVLSLPSMLSLHSRVEGAVSKHEEQEVYAYNCSSISMFSSYYRATEIFSIQSIVIVD